MRTKKHLVKTIVTFVMAIALVIGMIPVMPGSIKAQAYSESGFLWNGVDGSAFVNTDRDDDSIGSCWYVITDNEDGGKSKVVFNQADPYGDGSTINDEDIYKYSGISGTAILDKGTLDYNPFVYICFDIYGKDEKGRPIPVDISNYWDGLDISYMCDCKATLELGLGDAKDAQIGYANPKVDLEANANGLVKEFQWEKFSQPAWAKADQIIPSEEVVKTLATVKIKIQAPTSNGGTFHFMIDRIGTVGSVPYTVVLEDKGYIITYEGVDGASFENSNPDRYTIKDSFTLNNPSREGYEFAGWTGTGLDAASTSVTIPEKSTGNRVYTATWTPIYNITTSAEHGSFTVKNGDTEVTTAKYNDTLTLTATPDTGYKFVSWTVKDKDNNDITVTDNTFTMPAGDVNISAKFKTLGSFEWIGKNGKAQVETYRGNETDTQGLWYVRTDANGYESISNYTGYGNSKVIFDKADPDGDSSTVTDDDVNKYWGVSGTAILDQGSLNANPFVYICFDIVGYDTDMTRVADDVSAWEGLSISYECDGDPELELSLGYEDFTIGSARPRVSLPEAVAGNGVVKNLAWSDFEQPSWFKGTTKISGNEAAEKLVTVMFKIQGKSGTYHFKIAGIGSYHDSHLTVPEDPNGYYSITYYLNEGTNAESNISKYTINTKTFTLADPSREGYKFAGWFSDAEFNTPATTTIERGSTGDREFYAKWVNIALETIDKINSLPNAQDVTFLDKKNIEDARASYDALSDENKNLVSEEILKKLTDAEYAFNTNFGNGTETNPYKVNTWDELKEAMAEGGFIRLSDNVTDPAPAEDSYLVVKSGKYVNLDLNGHTIDRGLKEESKIKNGYVIKLSGYSTLDLYDSQTGGTITGGYSYDGDGGGIYITSKDSTLNMYGGTITRNTSAGTSVNGNGGGIYNGGTFNMYEGAITGNKALKVLNSRGAFGGGIYTSNGNFYMYGGTISGNFAEKDGNNIYNSFQNSTSKFIMTGGTIDGGISSYKNIYALSFDPNGGDGTMTEQYISDGTDTPLKNFEYTAPAGKLFKGWSFTANGDVKFTNKQKIKIEYYHNYIDDDNYESGYSLTIYNNDGTEIVDSIEIGENSTVKLYAIYVDKATLAPTVTITDWTYGDYGDTPVTPSIERNLGGGAVTYTYSSDGKNFVEEVPFNAGDYIVKATIEETDVYKSAEVTKAFSIKKKPVTITAGSATKVYDGTALTSDDYTVSENALVYEEVLSEVTLTGSQTEVGSSANVASGAKILNGEIDVTANYDITYVNGTLTVTEPAEIANGYCGDPDVNGGKNVTWVLDEAGTLTISGTGAMRSFSYDPEYQNFYSDLSTYFPWLENRGFIKNVIINDGVTNIGDYAFYDCDNLTSITLPESMRSIGMLAFAYCSSLTSITLPDKLTSIGGDAFYACESLESINIPDSVTSIGDSAFDQTTWLNAQRNEKDFVIVNGMLIGCGYNAVDVTIPENVTSIVGGAFSGCGSLTTVTIPKSVTTIGYQAFFRCSSLTSVYVNNTEVPKLGEGAFEETNDDLIINVPSGKVFDYIDAEDWSAYAQMIRSEGIIKAGHCGDPNVNGGKNLTWVLDDTGTLTISGTGAMKDYSYDLDSWDMNITPEPVIDTPWYDASKDIKTVVLNKGLTRIGEYAFDSFENITSITIPESVETIGYSAFSGCSSLTDVRISEGMKSIGDYIFYGCSSLTSITIPNSVTSIGNGVFVNCNSLTSITIPASVTSIGSFAFYTENIKSVVAEVGENALTIQSKPVYDTALFLFDVKAPATGMKKLVTTRGELLYDETSGKVKWLVQFTDPNEIQGTETAVISYAEVTPIVTVADAAYTGSALQPAVTVKDGEKTLTLGTDYTVSYSNNTNVGTGTVTITGKGIYCGSTSQNFSIEMAAAPNKPEATMTVDFGTKKVSDIALSDGWSWADADQDKELTVGTAINAVAVYNGADKDIYADSTKSVSVSITRAACTHEGCETEIKDAKAANCTEAGYTGDTYCKTCGDKISTGTVISALGHNLTAHATVAATCTAEGNTAYWSCDRCEKYFADAECTTEISENSWITSKIAHTFDKEVATTAYLKSAADCTHKAVYFKSCQCGEKGTETFEYGEALGHDYQVVPGSAVEVTLYTDGKQADIKCSRCHDVIEGAVIPKHAHVEETITAVAPTCTSVGYTEGKKCSICGTILVAPVEIAAPGHDYQVVPGSALAATCTEAGHEADQECSRCHDVIPGAVINANGHNMAAHEAHEATLDAEGNSAYWSCDKCGKFFADAEGKVEISEGSWVIAKLEPVNNQGETGSQTPTENQGETGTQTPTENQGETGSQTPTENQGETGSQTPTENQGETGTQTPTENQGETGTQTPTENQGETGTQTPTENQGETGTQTPTENQGETGTQTPTENQGETGTQTPTENQGEPGTQTPTENQGQTGTQTPTENQGEPGTQTPTENQAQTGTVTPTTQNGSNSGAGKTDAGKTDNDKVSVESEKTNKDGSITVSKVTDNGDGTKTTEETTKNTDGTITEVVTTTKTNGYTSTEKVLDAKGNVEKTVTTDVVKKGTKTTTTISSKSEEESIKTNIVKDIFETETIKSTISSSSESKTHLTATMKKDGTVALDFTETSKDGVVQKLSFKNASTKSSDGKIELELANLKTNDTTVEIPSEFSDGVNTYTVTELGSNMLSGNKTIDTIIIPTSIQVVNDNALAGVRNPENVIFRDADTGFSEKASDKMISTFNNLTMSVLRHQKAANNIKKRFIQTQEFINEILLNSFDLIRQLWNYEEKK